jgi:short-subunit dehydrogenase involved in D-alanine esterification of teichoic acids
MHNWVIEKFKNINVLVNNSRVNRFSVRQRISPMRAGIILMSISIR